MTDKRPRPRIVHRIRQIAHQHYDRANDKYTKVPADPALDDLAVAYYQTAYELFRARKFN